MLQKYKIRPWVMRQNGASLPSISKRVTIVIEKSFSDFDTHDEEILRHALASFLQITVDSISIIGTTKGSIRVLVELPAEAASKLLEAFKTNDPHLEEYLLIYPVRDIVIEGDYRTGAKPIYSGKQIAAETSGLEPAAEDSAWRDYEERFRRLFEDRYPVVRLFFTRKGLAAETAQLLAQETFVKLYAVGFSKSFKELDSLVFSTVREVYLSAHDKDDPASYKREREQQKVLQHALEELPSQMRQAVILRTGNLAAEAAKAKLFVSQLIRSRLSKSADGGSKKP